MMVEEQEKKEKGENGRDPASNGFVMHATIVFQIGGTPIDAEHSRSARAFELARVVDCMGGVSIDLSDVEIKTCWALFVAFTKLSG